MSLAERVAEFLRRHRLEETVGVVAVSGGPDSVALAHLLHQKVARLIFAHVNHQLRGDESDADEAFVRSLPATWSATSVTVRSERIPVAQLADSEGANLESIARRERYRWLTQVAREENAAWIAVGHSADDQAETVLFRLLRGSGLRGLGAMHECRTLDDCLLIRPLLGVRRREILAYLDERKLAYRIDSSNRELRFTRNRLRLELMPMLETHYNASIVDALCRLGEQAQEQYAEVRADAEELLHAAELPRAGAMLIFALDRLRDEPANRVREMFRLVWERERWPASEMDFDSWDRFAALVQGALTAWDFPRGIHARVRGKVLQLWRELS